MFTIELIVVNNSETIIGHTMQAAIDPPVFRMAEESAKYMQV